MRILIWTLFLFLVPINPYKMHNNHRRPTSTQKSDLPVALKVEQRLRLGNEKVSTRQINGAIKVFADLGASGHMDDGFRRSLRLFRLMRKTNTPTAVTYSTLMSRAVRMRKNEVAFRLWGIMLRSDPPPPVDTR
jgi:hypothetical protein